MVTTRSCNGAGHWALFGARRIALTALLGMVNHTAQWCRPSGWLGPEEIADGFVDLVLCER